MSKQKTEQKYFQALKDLRDLLRYTDKMSEGKWQNERRLPHSFIMIAARHGLIDRKGNRKTYRYKWNTIEPTLEMARELRLKMNEYSKENIKRQKEKMKQDQTRIDLSEIENKHIEKIKSLSTTDIVQSNKPNKETETKSFSILWGLFSFKRTIEK